MPSNLSLRGHRLERESMVQMKTWFGLVSGKSDRLDLRVGVGTLFHIGTESYIAFSRLDWRCKK
jgi:hypothetical protein